MHPFLQDIGCAVGSLITFFCGESIGRKRMIMAGAATMLVGTVRMLFLSGCPRFDRSAGNPDQLDHLGSAVRGEDRHRNRTYSSVLCPDVLLNLGILQGNGFNSSSIPVYQSETCGGLVRGALVCLNSTVTIIGLVIVSAYHVKCPQLNRPTDYPGVLARLRDVVCERSRTVATAYR